MNETEKQNNLFLSFLLQLILAFICFLAATRGSNTDEDIPQAIGTRHVSHCPCAQGHSGTIRDENASNRDLTLQCVQKSRDLVWPETRADRSMCTVHANERSESNRCLAGPFSLKPLSNLQEPLSSVRSHTEHWPCVLRPRLQARFCCFKVLGPWICPGLSFLNFKTKLWKILWREMRIQSKGMK